MKIRIDGELEDVDSVNNHGYLPMIKIGKREYYVAESSEEAGEKAAKYYEDMANNDKKEFACLIGDERLIQWALGESDSFGISSLDNFLEVTATVPEEMWGGYDGSECEVNLPEAWSKGNSSAPANAEDIRDFITAVKDMDEEGKPILSEEDIEELEGFAELIDELGFVPSVAYRHN